MNILRPQLAPKGKVFDTWITGTSAIWQRIAAVQLTRYFSLETSYSPDLTDNAVAWEKIKTSVFAVREEDFPHRNGGYRDALIGIITFHQLVGKPTLYHCYLHPFFRHKGLMEQAWIEIQLKYPKFQIERPLTPAMVGFLQKVNCQSCLQTIT